MRGMYGALRCGVPPHYRRAHVLNFSELSIRFPSLHEIELRAHAGWHPDDPDIAWEGTPPPLTHYGRVHNYMVSYVACFGSNQNLIR